MNNFILQGGAIDLKALFDFGLTKLFFEGGQCFRCENRKTLCTRFFLYKGFKILRNACKIIQNESREPSETTEKVRFFRLKKSPFSMQLLENGDFKLMF